MPSDSKWTEMQQLGMVRFVWRERALYIGLPVGTAVSVVVGGWWPRRLSDFLGGDAFGRFWVPLAVSIVVGALVGYAEWDREKRKANPQYRDEA